MKALLQLSLIISSLFLLSGCAVSKHKNIVYNKETTLSLNVFSPEEATKPAPVLLYIHGGSWVHGKKSTYNFFGKGMARKGVVAVIIDYRLSPNADNRGMAMDVASSLKWVKENIAAYGGDPERIFVSGHSAGGQLAALVAIDDRYFDSLKIKNPVKGTVLIDAFGLDMYRFLNESNYNRNVYLSVFSKDSSNWKSLSPQYILHENMPPFILFVGGRTGGAIISSNNAFYSSLQKFQPAAQLINVKGTAHIGMIFRFYNPRKKAYGQIINFMNTVK